VVERGECTHDTHHDGHGMGVAPEAIEETSHLVMDHGVVIHGAPETLVFLGGRQFAVKQQVADLKVVRVLRQLLNGITAMQENTVGAINEGNTGFARGGGNKTGIEGEPAFLDQAANINDVWPFSTGVDRKFQCSATD